MFKAESSSAAIPNPVSEATILFIHFEQVEMNDLDLAGFWGTKPPYVDFHGYWVPDDYVRHLEAVYHSHGTSCKGSLLAILLGSISLSCWGA